MGLDIGHSEGQTPLDEEEREGLLIPAISTRGELNEHEQRNIEQAVQWSLGLKPNPERLFTEDFIRSVHKRMFAEVWSWAGEFRKTDKNLGVEKWRIATELRLLLDDASFWHVNGTHPPDETALRFKHRLESIHCFPNGNSRHSRLMADIIVEKLYRRPVFSWGAGRRLGDVDARTAYLKAVKSADTGDYTQLLEFARS